MADMGSSSGTVAPSPPVAHAGAAASPGALAASPPSTDDAPSKQAAFQLYFDQVFTLLLKDFLLSKRSFGKVLCSCVCPAFMLFFSTFFILFIDEDIGEEKYQTVNVRTRMVQAGSSYPFDPFPAQCGQLGSSEYVDSFASWRDEQQKPLPNGYDLRFDCFIDAMADVVPFWRELVLQVRQQPAWTPTVQTFAVSPGVDNQQTTLGGRFKAYLNSRYDEQMYLSLKMYELFEQKCFSLLPTTQGGVYSSNSGNYCIENDPVACLSACQDGAGIAGRVVPPNSANVTVLANATAADHNTTTKMLKAYYTDPKSQNDYLLNTTAGGGYNGNYVEPISPHLVVGSFAHELNAIVAAHLAMLSAARRRNLAEARGGGDLHLAVEADNFEGGAEDDEESPFRQLLKSGREAEGPSEGAANFGSSGDLEGSAPLEEDLAHLRSGGDFLRKLRTVYDGKKAEKEAQLGRKIFAGSSGGKTSKATRRSGMKTKENRADKVHRQLSTPMLSPTNFEKFFFGDRFVKKLDKEMQERRRAKSKATATATLPDDGGFSRDDEELEFSPRRRLSVSCDNAKSACACARLRPDCGWFQQAEDSDDGSCRESVNSRGGARGEVAVETSCFECPTQESFPSSGVYPCQKPELWKRVGNALPLLKPHVAVYADENAILDVINGKDYPRRYELAGTLANGTAITRQVSEMFCGAVSFLAGADGEGTAASDLTTARLEPKIQFDIRTNESDVNGRDFGYTPQFKVAPRASEAYLSTYTRSGFLGLQNVVNDFLSCDSDAKFCFLGSNFRIADVGKKPHLDLVAMNNFGIPKFWRNARLMALFGDDDGVSESVFFGLCIPILILVGRILREKELKIREGMKVMGLHDLAYYTAVTLFHSIFSFFAAIPLMFVFSVMPDFQKYSGGGFLFWFFWVNGLHCLQLALFLTSFFNNATFGKIACMGVVSLSGLFGTILPSVDVAWSAGARIGLRRFVAMLCPGTTTTYALRIWYELEMRTDGVTGDTFGTRITSKTTDFSFADCIFMTILGVLIYTLLFCYADQILPSEYGIPRKWYFPFTRQFWLEDVFGKYDLSKAENRVARSEEMTAAKLERANSKDTDASFGEEAGGARGKYFEKPTLAQQEMHRSQNCVKVRNLRKEFDIPAADAGQKGTDKFVAVNDINLTMYRDEIFVLLGHNGAGKTTTFSMLYGLIPMTRGQCSFFGLSAKQQLSANRSKVGICPQHSVLWEDLTVLEHLRLFAYFKGVSRADAEQQADELLREQVMVEKRDALARTLSGGMQRKLSLAIAFMGDPSLVFLDEPSSGMDTSARREIWDLLRTRKEGRVIVLTTHYMDEADVLADRVAIMSHGVVKCVGTTNFLKKAYGCGYNLSFNCDRPALEVVEKFCQFLDSGECGFEKGDCKLMTTSGSEMLFLVPFDISPKFPTAFDMLERKDVKERFGLLSWQLLVCNLEEVFLKVASDQADDDEKMARTILERTGSSKELGGANGKMNLVSSGGTDTEKDAKQAWEHVELHPSNTRQLAALLNKRLINGKRYWATTFCQLTCPVAYLLIIIVITKLALMDWPRLQLTADTHYNLEKEKAGDRLATGAVTAAGSSSAEVAALLGDGLTTELLREHYGIPLLPEATLQAQTCPWNGECEAFSYEAGDAQWGALSPYGGCTGTDAAAKKVELGNALSKNYGAADTPTTFPNPIASLTAAAPKWVQYVAELRKLDYWLEENTKTTKADEAKYGAFLLARDSSSTPPKISPVIKVNATGIHAAPIYLQQFHDASARNAGQHGERIPYLHPLPTTAAEKIAELNDAAFELGMGIILSFGFVSCFGLVFIVEEKEKEIKVQQYVNGVQIWTYWLSNLLWDFSLYLFPIFTILGLFEAFELTLFTNSRAIGASFCLLLSFSLAMPLFSYIIAHQFRSADSAMSISIVLNVIFSFVLFLVGLLLEVIPFDVTRSILKDFGWIFRFWPMYALGEGVRRIFFASYYWQSTPPDSVPDAFWPKCEQEYDEHKVPPWECCQSIFDRFGAGPAITYLVLEVFLYYFFTCLLDYAQQDVRIRQFLEPKAPVDRTRDPVNCRSSRDAGVLREEQAAETMPEAEIKETTGVYCRAVSKVFEIHDVLGAEGERVERVGTCEECCGKCCLCCPGLVKTCFDRTKPKTIVHAVRDCTFALKRGEVLGLLGANGAGKTTTFRMLCGITVPARHAECDIRIGGHSIVTERDKCRKVIGYTSQFNPIWDSMTVEEHLLFYAGVKGVPPELVASTIENTIKDMDLVLHRKKRAGTLSGGNKRKLVIAMSLIGAPPVLFLDEPSAGMDPEARRNMWSIIQRIATKQKQSTVILTTHSMDECEALCSKVSIQTQGVMRCFGSISEIKQQYGSGFDLFVKFLVPDFETMVVGEVWKGLLFGAPELSPYGATSVGAKPNKASDNAISLFAVDQYLAQLQMQVQQQQQQGPHQAATISRFAYLLPRLQWLLRASRSSPFSAVSRLASKPPERITPAEMQEMQQSSIKPNILLHWIAQSIYRLQLTDWVVSENNFPGSFMVDSQGGSEQVTFRIFAGQDRLGEMFQQLEGVKSKFMIKEYAISPTSLEQIFNTFTRSGMADGSSGGGGSGGAAAAAASSNPNVIGGAAGGGVVMTPLPPQQTAAAVVNPMAGEAAVGLSAGAMPVVESGEGGSDMVGKPVAAAA